MIFMIAYGSARARGLDIACGCFEVGENAKPSSAAWVFLRDGSLLVAALLVARFGAPSPLDLLRRRFAPIRHEASAS